MTPSPLCFIKHLSPLALFDMGFFEPLVMGP